MRNRDWLNNMALIDLLSLFNKCNDQCVLCMLGVKNFTDRCDKYNDDLRSVFDCCYDCLCDWLNEKNI